MKIFYCIAILTSLLATNWEAQGANLDQKLLAYCEKVKSCAFKQIESQEIPEQYHSMVISSMKNMCDNIKNKMSPYLADPAVVKGAENCVDSLTALKCDKLMSMESETKQCKSFNKMLSELEKP